MKISAARGKANPCRAHLDKVWWLRCFEEVVSGMML